MMCLSNDYRDLFFYNNKKLSFIRAFGEYWTEYHERPTLWWYYKTFSCLVFEIRWESNFILV